MSMVQLLEEGNVPYETEGHKHTRAGWIQVACPFCTGHEGLHLGYNLDGGFWNCYRCGWKSSVLVVATLLSVSYTEAKALIKKYLNGRLPSYAHIEKNAPATCEPPGGPLEKQHVAYLKGRRFNPKKLVEEWGLLGTSIYGPYKNRVIAPIVHNGRVVSYQGRAIYDGGPWNMGEKYKACRKEEEVIHHKHICYGLDRAPGDACVVVEGITDVWRLGAGAVSTFGIKFTSRQVNLLSLKFNKVTVLFDGNELQASQQADKLAYALDSLEVYVRLATLSEGDPGEMDAKEAADFMASIL